MSHEIRSPLNAIVGFSQILINQVSKMDVPGEFKRYLKNIKNSGQHLSDLINDILDLSKIEAGKMTLSEEVINLKQLIQTIYHVNKDTAEEKGIRFNFDFSNDVPILIISDRSKLKQILMNLLSNAIKFTPPTKSINIHVVRIQNEIQIDVIDEGIGIEEDKQQLIFDPFVQADSGVTRQYGGTGLGLSITKRMVDLLGGSISLTSRPKQGSTFSVKLPYIVPESEILVDQQIDLSQHKLPADASILVVEDNPMNQEMIRAMFQEMDHDIIIAANGIEGVEFAKQYAPDLIFMDIHMPGIDGFETFRRIKLSDPSVPIVALSADAFKEQQEKAISFGFHGYLTKPLQLSDLISTLERFLEIERSKNDSGSTAGHPWKDSLQVFINDLQDIPLYETEKLVELVNRYFASAPTTFKESLLSEIYAVNEKGIYQVISDEQSKS